jgi:hypothetical protein
MNGIPTHFDRRDGEPVAIESYVHLFSEHVQAAHRSGWTLVEMDEGVVDDAWIAKKPKWECYRHHPVSFAMVWRKREPLSLDGAPTSGDREEPAEQTDLSGNADRSRGSSSAASQKSSAIQGRGPAKIAAAISRALSSPCRAPMARSTLGARCPL